MVDCDEKYVVKYDVGRRGGIKKMGKLCSNSYP